jgi:hypothetical protein
MTSQKSKKLLDGPLLKPKPILRTGVSGHANRSSMLNDTSKSRKFQGCSTLNPKPIQRIGIVKPLSLSLKFSKT